MSKIKKIECETKVHPGLKIFFGYGLYKSGLLFRNILESGHLKQFDLTAAESGILYILSTGTVTNQLTLGHDMGIDKASIVKIIDKLEKMKLVRRDVDSEDRRSKLVSLTPKGKITLEKLKSHRNYVEEQIFAHFSKEDQHHLKRLIPGLLEALMNIN